MIDSELKIVWVLKKIWQVFRIRYCPFGRINMTLKTEAKNMIVPNKDEE